MYLYLYIYIYMYIYLYICIRIYIYTCICKNYKSLILSMRWSWYIIICKNPWGSITRLADLSRTNFDLHILAQINVQSLPKRVDS